MIHRGLGFEVYWDATDDSHQLQSSFRFFKPIAKLADFLSQLFRERVTPHSYDEMFNP